MIPQNNKLFLDPGLSYPNDNLDLPFADYINRCKTLIENTRLDLNANEMVLPANMPYELKPDASTTKTKSRYGVLLIHGLYDCPLIMRDLGETLQKRGFLVRSILLPGHGTVPGALLNVRYQDWVQAVHYGVTSLTLEVDKIFLGGFSTGGTLALFQLLTGNYQNIAGVIAFAPALQISPLASLTGIPAHCGLLWMRKAPEIDYARYNSFTYNSVKQIYLLGKAVEKLLQTKALTVPQLIVISQHDKTVRSNATLGYFKRYASLTSQLIIYQNSSDKFDDHRIIVRPSSYPEQNIRDISHIALPIAPDNKHYGIQGDFPLASHVEENMRAGGKIIYGTYNTLQNDVLNELNKVGLVKQQRVRLTFNPDFAFFQQAVADFTDKIISSSLT